MSLVFLLCLTHLVFAIPLQDLNSQDINTDYAIVDFSNVVEHRIRHKRQTSSGKACDLKDQLLLPITYKGNTKTLNLTRNNMYSPATIPVLKKGTDGLLSVATSSIENRVSALYYYTEDLNKYGIMVTCNFDESCNPVCEIQGDLLTEDECVEIAGSAADKEAKRSKLLSEVPHNVKQLPESQYKSFGAGEIRKPGFDRNGNVDTKLPPLLTKKERKNMKDMLSKGKAKDMKDKIENLKKKADDKVIDPEIAEATEEEKTLWREIKEKYPSWSKRRRRKLYRKLRFKLRKGGISGRRKREASFYQEHENIIELLITNDYQLFNSFKYWGGKSFSDDEAVTLMVEFICHAAAGIDLRMHNIRNYAPDIKLRVHINGIYAVTKPEEASEWADHPVDVNGTTCLDADAVIENLAKFVFDNGHIFSEFDHVMAITGQNLARYIDKFEWWETGILGYTFSDAKNGILCNQPYYSVSVIEAPAMGWSSRVGAHEIAHNMRAGHDVLGGPEGCSMTEQFIMAESIMPAGKAYKTNPYRFSSCSTYQIQTHLYALDNIVFDPANNGTLLSCMKHEQSGDPFGLLNQLQMTGERYNYDIQCKYLMHDTLSTLCVEPKASYCYNAIYCTSSSDPTACYSGYAYNGSPCNSTASCFEGECMLRSLIPEVEEDD